MPSALEEDAETSPQEAKVIWDEMEDPTLERVRDRLVSAGKKITLNKLGLWQQNNWYEPTSTPEDVTKAVQVVDGKVPLITGNPRNGVDSLMPEKKIREKGYGKELAILGDEKLIRNVNRDALIMLGVLFREVQSKRKALMKDPVAASAFIRALGDVLEKVLTCTDKATAIAEKMVRAEELANRTTIDLNAIPDDVDPIGATMRSFAKN